MNLFTVKEAAAELKVNPMTIYRWIKSGALDPVRLGRIIRIRGEDVDGIKNHGLYRD